jgi:hypothetical protein
VPRFLEGRSSVSCLPKKELAPGQCATTSSRVGKPRERERRANGKWVTVFGTKKHEETVEESQL